MGMNIISKYIEQLQVEEIAIDLISKTISLILLLTVFLIAKTRVKFHFHTLLQNQFFHDRLKL